MSGSSYEPTSFLDQRKLSSFLILKATEQFPPQTFRPWFCFGEKKKNPGSNVNVTALWVFKLFLNVKYFGLCKVSGIYLIMVIFCFLLSAFFFFFVLEKYLKKEGGGVCTFQPQQTSPGCLLAMLTGGLTTPAGDRLQQDRREKMQFVRMLGKWASLNVTIFLMVIITPCIAHLG